MGIFGSFSRPGKADSEGIKNSDSAPYFCSPERSIRSAGTTSAWPQMAAG